MAEAVIPDRADEPARPNEELPRFEQRRAIHGGRFLIGYIVIVVLFGLFWLLLVRPQRKRAVEQRELLSSLERRCGRHRQSWMVGRGMPSRRAISQSLTPAAMSRFAA